MFFDKLLVWQQIDSDLLIWRRRASTRNEMRGFWSGSAGEAVCWGGEGGGVMLREFEDFAGEHSVEGSARRSEGGGRSIGYRLFHRPPILLVSVIVIVRLCVWVCGLWDCRFVFLLF